MPTARFHCRGKACLERLPHPSACSRRRVTFFISTSYKSLFTECLKAWSRGVAAGRGCSPAPAAAKPIHPARNQSKWYFVLLPIHTSAVLFIHGSESLGHVPHLGIRHIAAPAPWAPWAPGSTQVDHESAQLSRLEAAVVASPNSLHPCSVCLHQWRVPQFALKYPFNLPPPWGRRPSLGDHLPHQPGGGGGASHATGGDCKGGG